MPGIPARLLHGARKIYDHVKHKTAFCAQQPQTISGPAFPNLRGFPGLRLGLRLVSHLLRGWDLLHVATVSFHFNRFILKQKL